MLVEKKGQRGHSSYFWSKKGKGLKDETCSFSKFGTWYLGPNEASERKKQELLSEEVRLPDGAEIPALQTEHRSKNGSLAINPLCHSVMPNLEPWVLKNH